MKSIIRKRLKRYSGASIRITRIFGRRFGRRYRGVLTFANGKTLVAYYQIKDRAKLHRWYVKPIPAPESPEYQIVWDD